MQSDRITAAQALIHECEELAQTRFDVPTRVDVGILPALDGDFWKAEVVQTTSLEAAVGGQAVSPLRIEVPLTTPCHARSKIAALEALRELLRAAPGA